MRLFCKHLDKPLEFVQNITADETGMAVGKRSVWRCKDCGKIILRSTPFVQGGKSLTDITPLMSFIITVQSFSV